MDTTEAAAVEDKGKGPALPEPPADESAAVAALQPSVPLPYTRRILLKSLLRAIALASYNTAGAAGSAQARPSPTHQPYPTILPAPCPPQSGSGLGLCACWCFGRDVAVGCCILLQCYLNKVSVIFCWKLTTNCRMHVFCFLALHYFSQPATSNPVNN